MSHIWQRVQKHINNPLIVFEALQARRERVGGVEELTEYLIQEARRKGIKEPSNASAPVPVARLISIDDVEEQIEPDGLPFALTF